MASYSAVRRVTVVNPQGLHARPAHALVTLASRFKSNIEILRDGEMADAKSILSLLTLAAEHGTQLTIRVQGDDALEALDAVAGLFARGFEADNHSKQGQESERGG
jgi:phosphotransferase system HPr (HPr) family protein